MSEWIEDLLSGLGGSITEGLTKAWNAISDTIWDKLLQWLYSAIFDSLADFFTQMGTMGMEIFNLPWVQAFIKLFTMFGWALFITGIVVTVFDVAIESQSGRINVKTASLNVLKGFFAVNLFAVLPIELYKFCISLQNVFSKDLVGLFTSQTSGVTSIADAASSALALLYGAPSLFNLALMIALAYCIIKIFFANIKRGGILLIQIAVGSLYMFSIPRGYSDSFFQWCKQIIALCITAFLQTTLLFLGLITWQTDWLMGIGIMLAANEVPRIAQMFGLDTSVKVNMGSAVHTTTSAVNLTRSLVRK